MTTQAVTTNKRTIKDTLEGDQFRQAVAKVLPKHLTPDRFVRVAIMAMTRTPKLAQCEPASFFQALMSLSQYGLEPDGRRAHLIPFQNNKRNYVECQLIIDYKGLAELVLRSGIVSNIHADVVCENDEFDYDCGEILHHKINFRSERGAVYAVYALCRFKDGSEKCDVMSKADVERTRNRSRAGNNGPWVTDWNEMAKKTVFRRLSKWLPLSPEIRDAVESEDEIEDKRLELSKPIFEDRTKTVAPMFEIPESNGEHEATPFDQGEGTDLGPQTTSQPEQRAPESAPAVTPAKADHLRALFPLMKMSKVTEAELLEHLREKCKCDESLASLEEVSMIAPSAIDYAYNEWASIVSSIKKPAGKK
jgi:recombination protein RecT